MKCENVSCGRDVPNEHILEIIDNDSTIKAIHSEFTIYISIHQGERFFFNFCSAECKQDFYETFIPKMIYPLGVGL